MQGYSSYSEWLRDNPGGTLGDYQRYAQNITAIENMDSVVNRAMQGMLGVQPKPERTYTRTEVSRALSNAANMVQDMHDYEDTDTVLMDTAVDLTVSVADYLLDHPDASLNEAIVAQYSDVVEIDEADLDDYEADLDDNAEDDELEEMPEKGSARWNELLVEKVKGWLA